jgi:AcrR family transcriptional regulator
VGIAERRSREKEERRSLILEKAKDLILERGIPSLNMQDIADAAELSKATLYLYFQSKEAILLEILNEAADAFVAFVEERIDLEDSGIGALKKLWGSYLDLFGTSPDLFVLTGIISVVEPYFPTGVDDGDDPSLHPERKLRGLIARVLEKGVADGTLDAAVDPAKIARIAMLIATAIINNVARMPREAREAHLIQEDMQLTFEMLLRGLAASGTDRALLSLAPEKE